MKKFILIIAFMLLAAPAFPAHLHLEKEYQAAWCSERGGIQEYRLNDGTRIDCLTERYAVEFDFAPKWAEGIGQALYYGIKTGKKPGIVLILETPGDRVFIPRLRAVADKYGIAIWFMGDGVCYD